MLICAAVPVIVALFTPPEPSILDTISVALFVGAAPPKSVPTMVISLPTWYPVPAIFIAIEYVPCVLVISNVPLAPACA